jgi:hypothetical protein
MASFTALSRRVATRVLIAAAITFLCVPSARAFRVESETVSPTGTAPVDPHALPPIRFVHWDLREFPNCKVPYAINQNGTPDIATVGDRIAINNAFNTWENVVPAIIGFDRRSIHGRSARRRNLYGLGCGRRQHGHVTPPLISS